MATTGELAVLMPFRNAGATVDEAVAGILAEDTLALELVAIDDGSTDDGPARIERWTRRDPRVRLVRSPGRGIVAALAAGLDHTRAPYIGRMDADDRSLPPRLQRQLALLESRPRVAVVGTRIAVFGEAVGEGIERYAAWQNAAITADDHRRELFIEAPLCHPSVVIRRSALEQVGGFHDPAWPEDYDLWLRLDRAGYDLEKVPEVLFEWRRHASTATVRDPRYSPEAFRAAKAHYLAARLRAEERHIVVWGAGPVGRRFARALERESVRAQRFIDIDPRKLERTARGAPIREPGTLDPTRDFVLVAVGSRGARPLIRADLTHRGFGEVRDFVCVA